MPEISFYVLGSHSEAERLLFACRLIEKIFRSGESCYVLTASTEQATELDKLLWSFRPGSFVPHQLYQGQMPQLEQTVLIGGNDIPASRQAIILNLSDSIPLISESTLRLLEILDNSETCKQAGRLRYKHYQQLGFRIETHKMSL
jgi:DNA polymerase-3 subunit chi